MPTRTDSSRTTIKPNAWRYRDYVINAFNQDKPYNQFLKEQIAGDELDYVTHETLIATGFLRAGPRVLFREKDNPERRWDYVDDLIATLGRGVMGMTVNCARCHNHKFDPIAQKDYYSLAAALNGWVETDWPLVASRTEAETYLKQNKDVDAKIDAVRKKISAIEKPYRDELRAAYIKKEYPENVQRAVFKPEAERTPGDQLLATQVLTGGGGGSPEEIDEDDEARGAGSEERADLADRGHRDSSGRRCRRWRRSLRTATGASRRWDVATRRSAVRNAGSHHPTGPTARTFRKGPANMSRRLRIS